jgi:hypothetical protein
MIFAVWVNKVFNFGHGKLAYTQETLARRDFISKRFANGGAGKGHLVIVRFKQAFKVDKVGLGSFGAQVALELASGANFCVKHQIEQGGFSESVIRFGGSNVQLFDQSIQILSLVVIQLD